MIRARLACLALLATVLAHTAEAQQREAGQVAWRIERMSYLEVDGQVQWRYTIVFVNRGDAGVTLDRMEESRWATRGATVGAVEEREIHIRIEPRGTAAFEAYDELAEGGKAHRTFLGRDDSGRSVRVDAVVDLRRDAAAIPRSPEAPPRPPEPPPAVTRIPIQPGGTAPIVVGGTVNGSRQVALILDTGASYTILSPRLLGQLGLSIPASARWVRFTIAGGQQVEAPLVTVESLEIGNSRVAPLEVLAYDALPDDPALDGLIGLNFLNHFAVTIDRNAGVLTIAPRASRQ